MVLPMLAHFRIIVPPDIGYPDNDLNKLGPKPTTFSVIYFPEFTKKIDNFYNQITKHYFFLAGTKSSRFCSKESRVNR
jgi:hypothetical protein